MLRVTRLFLQGRPMVQTTRHRVRRCGFVRLGVVWQVRKQPFHTTPSRQALPAAIIVMLRPVAKFAAMVFGRTVRKWWGRLSPEQKEAVLDKFRSNKAAVVGVGTMAVFGAVYYYASRLEYDPITGRRKFIAFNKDQIKQLAMLELEMQAEIHKDHFLAPSHPFYARVVNICNRILESNRDLAPLQQHDWIVTVVDKPDIANAFVLPTGNIFVFTGILTLCKNDDQLCVVLSHEMSHVLLNHNAEQISSLHLWDLLILIPLALMWAILPDAAAIVAQSISSYLTKVMFQLPFSRALESEADRIGLVLAAKTCYDIREASAFWGRMKSNNSEEEFLSTHPSYETRQVQLDAMIPEAIKLRELCKCPTLPLVDPRKR